MTDLNCDRLDQLLRDTNMRTYLEFEAAKLGTEAQLEDYAKGTLPETVLRALARDHLFIPFRDQPRWVPMQWSAVTHKHTGCLGAVEFQALGPPESSDRLMEDDALKIKALCFEASRHQWCIHSREVFRVEFRGHLATCTGCGAQTSRLSALVSVVWAVRTLSREFAL
jgi:hypothetical protein